MSRFSEKRLAEQLSKIVQPEGSPRRRRDLLLIGATFAGGLWCNVAFSKVELAATFWTFMLGFLADLALSFGKLANIKLGKRLLLDGCIVGLLWCPTYPFFRSQYKSQHAALVEGVLRARRDGKDHSHEMPMIQLGDGPKFGFNFQFPKDDLKIRRDGNEIKFSTTVRDTAGNLVVEVVDNHWRVSSSQANCWDKNYTDDSLEVKDGTGRVVLQVRLLPDRIQIQAEWPTSQNKLVDGRFFTERYGITPKFKYPSADHFGEFDEGSGYTYENN